MKFRQLGRFANYSQVGKSQLRVKVDDYTCAFQSSDTEITFENVNPGQPVQEYVAPRFQNLVALPCGGFDPNKLYNSGDGQIIARIRLRSNLGKSELFIGKWGQLMSRLEQLGSDAASFYHEDIRDDDVMSERQFRDWSKLEDAKEALRGALQYD